MLSFKIIITDPIGLHARPASKIASVAAKFQSNISLVSGTKKVSAKSIMFIMTLGAKTNTELEFIFDGSDEQAAHDAVREVILAENLGK